TPTPKLFLDHFGSFLFVPYAYPGSDIDALTEAAVASAFEAASLYRLLHDDPDQLPTAFGLRRDALRELVRACIADAGVGLDRCFALAMRTQPDVVGFSATFETQIPAAVALARRLRREHPEVKIVFGGSAFAERQADAMIAVFDDVDAICHTEGEHVI